MEIKLSQYKEALDGFEKLLNIDLKELKKKFGEVVIDGLKNGQAQKFEYCSELCWKIVKIFLYKNDGIDTRSPKRAIKEFYLAGYIDKDNYLKLFNIIDDRNKLSHIYNEKEFNDIADKFKDYLISLKTVYNVINKNNR